MCYIVNSDGSDGCSIAFMAREYVPSKNGSDLNGVLAWLLVVLLPDNENRTSH